MAIRSESPEHGWAQGRLDAFRAGLLDDIDDARVRVHVSGCAACRAALAATTPAGRAGWGEHVPAAILARWPAGAGALPALERELVEHHLARCETCRADLALALATRGASASAAAAPGWRLARATWAAGVATAALLAFALAWNAGFFRAAPTRVPQVASGNAFALDVRPGEGGTHLRDVSRGGPLAAEPELALARGEQVVLDVEPPDVPDDTPVMLELSHPGAAPVASALRLERELYPARRVVIGSPAAPLPAGRWQLRVIARPASAAPDTQSYAFMLARR